MIISAMVTIDPMTIPAIAPPDTLFEFPEGVLDDD